MNGKLLKGLVAGSLLAGLFLTYDASRQSHSSFDVGITHHVQDLDFPGLEIALTFFSELTNFYPAVAIWGATFLMFFALRMRVEAFALLLAVAAFMGVEALGNLVARPRPSSDLIEVRQMLVGNSFPSGHVFGAVVFYGLLVGAAWRRLDRVMLRLLITTGAAFIIGAAGLARVYFGVHWTSDVVGGLLLGTVTLAGILWIYGGMKSGYVRLLGLQFHVIEAGKER